MIKKFIEKICLTIIKNELKDYVNCYDCGNIFLKYYGNSFLLIRKNGDEQIAYQCFKCKVNEKKVFKEDK